MTTLITKLAYFSSRTKLAAIVAVTALVITMGGTWMTATTASAAPPPLAAAAAGPPGAPGPAPSRDGAPAAKKSNHKDLTGKLNLNTATEEQLMLLPTVGPAKAERVVTWRKKNGGFKRTEDLRHVKGFGYKTWKKLSPYLDTKGDTTLAAK